MNRVRALSGLVCGGLLAAAAVGQDPKPAAPKPMPDKPAAKADDVLLKNVTSFEVKDPAADAVTAAMQYNPAVQVANAEVQLAQAKRAQVRVAVAQQVTEAVLAVAEAKSGVAAAETLFAQMGQLAGAVAPAERAQSRAALDTAKAKLARAESALHGLTGIKVAVGGDILGVAFDPAGRRLAALGTDGSVRIWETLAGRSVLADQLLIDAGPPAPPGSPLDALRGALDKRVAVAVADGVGIEAAVKAVLTAAGLDLRVRVSSREDPKLYRDFVKLTLPADELTVGGWLQFIADTASDYRAATAEPGTPAGKRFRYEVYVREYGLLVTGPDAAPADAVTVQQLWQQARAKAAAEKTPKK